MRATVVLPLGFGILSALAGAGFTAVAGWPILAVLLCYSLCGALGVVAGGVVNMLFTQPGSGPLHPAAGLGEGSV